MRQLVLDPDWLRQNNIRGVFQAGMGDAPQREIDVWNSAGIKNQIYIEAYPHYAQICKNYCDSLQADGYNRISISGALTNIDGKTSFFVNSQYLSHSVLDMDKNRHDVVKSMTSLDRIEVDAYTVDGIFEKYNLNPENYNLLFLDTQCSEHLVLEGAKKSLKYFDYIQAEIAMHVVYEGALLYDEWIKLMLSLGYKSIYEFSIPVNGVELGRDVTFEKINK